MARGGARQGKVGAAYPNRSDLNMTKPISVTSVEGLKNLPYGQKQSLKEAVAGTPAQPAPPAPAPTPQPTPQPPGPETQAPLPGSFGHPLRPTERPNEPITSGLATGPGVGPEALQSVLNETMPLSQRLDLLARESGSPELVALAAMARSAYQ